MKLIKPYFEIIEQQSGLEGMYKQIELCGRVAYKSEDKITEDSYKGFVDRMIKLNHGVVLEHGTVYLYRSCCCYDSEDNEFIRKYENNKYSNIKYIGSDDENYNNFKDIYGNDGIGNQQYVVTTNLRVLVENNWLDDLKYLCEPTKYHEKRICVRFICDRGVSHEFVRHRTFSFLMESTRYCNYSNDKFGNELTFIEPCWLESYNYAGNTYYNGFLTALRAAEANYLSLLKQWEDKIPDKRYKTGFRNNPWKPQEARAVLPNALKTELIMTGFVSDWKHFFKLRCSANAHPQARELAIPLQTDFLRRKYIINLYDEANPD